MTGKTCLMKRYVEESFHCQSLTTIGVDFNVKTIQAAGRTVKLQIWWQHLVQTIPLIIFATTFVTCVNFCFIAGTPPARNGLHL